MVLSLFVPTAIALASEFFPLLVTKIAGSKAGEVAEKVVETAAVVADLPVDADVKDIISRIKGDKEATLKLQYEFELLNQQEHERILEDRKSAREYQMAMGPGGRTRGDIMLIAVAVGLIICISLVILKQPMNQGILALVTTVSGALLKMFSDAFAFEFGSSRGSKEKDLQVREFKEALLQIGKDGQREMADVAKAQVKRLDMVKRREDTSSQFVATQTEDQTQMPTSRNFVKQLIMGNI
nr:hypothetical protein [uncultured Cohaesibacter sp.]